MFICINKKVLGTPRHLFTDFEEQSTWVDEAPEDCFLFGFSKNEDLSILESLSGVEVRKNPPEKYFKPFKGSNVRQIAWKDAIPRSQYKRYIQNVQNDIRKILCSDQREYLEKRIRNQQKLISSLQPAHIDEKIFARRYADPTTVNKSVLTSFTPMKGVTKKVGYNLTGTSTGRLTISEGPQILTLKAEMRDILTSRYEGGKIMQFDYVSLEPRVALILSGQDPVKDIYTDLCDKVLDSQHGRQTAKLLTIATLYGMGVRRVKELIGVSKHTAYEVLKKLEIFFGVSEVKAHLEEEAKSGFIKNHFGRNIRVRNDASHVLYNNYIQSSAMDAALEGFYQIVQGVEKEDHKCVPLFLLHDAIIFDCHPECFDKLEDIMAPGQQIPAFKSQLYMGAEEL